MAKKSYDLGMFGKWSADTLKDQFEKRGLIRDSPLDVVMRSKFPERPKLELIGKLLKFTNPTRSLFAKDDVKISFKESCFLNAEHAQEVLERAYFYDVERVIEHKEALKTFRKDQKLIYAAQEELMSK